MPSKLTMLRSWLTACLLLFASIAFAQTRTVTGKVTNATDKQPVIGATVTVKGTTVATQTDESGNFSINVPQGRNTLVITSVGMASSEVALGNSNTVEISLSTSQSALEEIVVTGYTSQRKKDITGSVAVVNVNSMKSVPASNATQMLQGQAAGVTVITSGQPGSGSEIRIRGINNFGNTAPLVIIDGVPGDLNGLNPNDVESIQVLKDAAAASIYGSRASNGVLIVTTKRGRQGKVNVTYDGFYGTQVPVKGFDLLNPQEMADLTWMAYKNSNQELSHPQYGTGATPRLPDYIFPAGAMEGDPLADPSKYSLDPDNYYQIVRANKAGTNWYDEIFSPAPFTNHTVTASGGSNKSSYLFSMGYMNQQGTLMETYLKRYTGRINTTFNLKDRVRIGENLQLSFQDNPQIGNQSEGNEISMAYRTQPIVPIYDINGKFASGKVGRLGQGSNPVAMRVRSKDNRGYNWNVFGNVFGEVDLIKGLLFRTSFGGTLNNGYYYYYNYRTLENAEPNASNLFSENAYYNRSWTWTNTLSYGFNLADKHDFKILVGTEAIEDYGRNVGGVRTNYFLDNPDYRNLNNGSPTGQQNYSGAYQSSLFSYIGRLDYTFDDKVILGATVRRDGSSRFGADQRYGVFPSVALALRLTSFDFMKPVTWLNDLKVRGSYGILGSQFNIPSVNAFTLFGGSPGSSYYDITGSNTSAQLGFRQTVIGNPALKWERNKLFNAGFDATMFNNTFDLSIEYYKKSIDGLLFERSLPATVGGAGRPIVNVGNVENSGLDITANYRGRFTRDLTFNVGLNGTIYKNNIVKLNENVEYFESGGNRIGNFVRNQVGHPASAFFGYKVIGLFQSAEDVSKSPTQDAAAPGRFKYADINNDNKIDDNDRTFIGNPNPDFTAGLNLGLAYKNFDFSAFVYGSFGNDVINYVRWWVDFFPSFQGVKSKDALYNSWTPDRPNAKVPIVENVSNFSNNQVVNSYYIENGSYVRLKQLSIGYSIPTASLQKAGLEKLRIYVQAANLFTITKYTGLDPELSGGSAAFGIDYGNYPNNQKTFIFGVNLGF